MKRKIRISKEQLDHWHPPPVEQDSPGYARTRHTLTGSLLLVLAIGLVLLFEHMPPIHFGMFVLVLARLLVMAFFLAVIINLIRPGTSRTWKVLAHIAFVLITPLFATSSFSRPFILFLFTVYFVWLGLKIWPAFRQEGFVWGLFVLAGVTLAFLWVWSRCVLMV